MYVLVTGSAGHLGEGLVRTLRDIGHTVRGLDILPSPFTDHVGSIVDRGFVDACLDGIDAVIHSATLHKPHIATHSKRQFVDTNITGTLNLLEGSMAHGTSRFLFTSTTSTFGYANRPPAGAPTAWITEDVRPVPRNIYGVTKTAAEDLCELLHRRAGLSCLILKTSRFFLEADDDRGSREAFDNDNLKANEFVNRRVDLQDVVDAHVLGLDRAPSLGFGRYILSATTPFEPADAVELRSNATAVLARRAPEFEAEYARRGWRMFTGIDRVYDNTEARKELGWRPRYDFRSNLARLVSGRSIRSDLADLVGCKPYHDEVFEDHPDPVE